MMFPFRYDDFAYARSSFRRSTGGVCRRAGNTAGITPFFTIVYRAYTGTIPVAGLLEIVNEHKQSQYHLRDRITMPLSICVLTSFSPEF